MKLRKNSMAVPRHRFSLNLAVFVLILGGYSLFSEVKAAKGPEVDSFWDVKDDSSSEELDHTVWNNLLTQFVDDEHDSGVNRFDYGALKASSDHLNQLRNYVLGLAEMDPRTLTKDVQMAYWINLYNALTVWVVTSDYPVESIRDINSSVFRPGPWKRKLLTIAEKSITLDNIEHNILRPIWKDPRIHYAVNCASIGCPNLIKQAFRADNLEELLDKGAREYINHSRAARVEDGKLIVSSIYEWFQVDFGGSEHGVIEHLRTYAEADLLSKLEQFDEYDNDDYNWKLNAP